MKRVYKGIEPQLLNAYKKQHPCGKYDDPEFRQYTFELRQHLVNEQQEICAYCCKKITADNDSSCIEHIEPRHNKDGSYSKRSLDYDNMVASCNTTGTCSNSKGNEYDDTRFISPLSPECEEKIEFLASGEILVTEENRYTVELLNLNDYDLCESRRAVGDMIDSILAGMDKNVFVEQGYVEMFADTKGFPDFIEQYLEM